MKTNNSILVLTCCLLLATCSEDETSSYNITGTWIGPYNGVQGSGTLRTYIVQAGSDVTGTYSAVAAEDTGLVVGKVDGSDFLATFTSIPFSCDAYFKMAIVDSLHMNGYYRSYETCADSGLASLVKQ